MNVPDNWDHIDGLVQERHNSVANALELHFFCTNTSTWWCENSKCPWWKSTRKIICIISRECTHRCMYVSWLTDPALCENLCETNIDWCIQCSYTNKCYKWQITYGVKWQTVFKFCCLSPELWNKRMETKITLQWAHKHFIITVRTIPYFYIKERAH